ncbi:HmuY family protein [Chryseolinea lacunae]|uniref:HmuY family protein n=1 Tax=Chryseolinea lacunae TaxID=2801331 RepID=A0ABS1KYC4_9BACT|nr:HmuY family protein [Chryseolinea lacunae]MBL0744379.1 HmuY family protein [Chryseolinea lacunae]
MKSILKLNAAMLFLALTVFTACSDDDDDNTPVKLTASEVKDLNSESTKNFTLFSFANGAVVANTDSVSSKWDIGFRGTTLVLNGGVSGPGQAQGQIVSGIFDELKEAPADGYTADSQAAKAIVGSGTSGWYTYTGTTSVPNHAILPNAGKVIVLKTADGKYVKVEIISYYKGNPSTTTTTFADLATRPLSRYFTFRYIYQPDGTRNFESTVK